MLISFNFRTFHTWRPPNWPSLPEPHPAQEEEAEDLVLPDPDLRVGEEVPQAEVPGLHGEGNAGKEPKDDGRTGQNVVPKQENKMEVRIVLKTK